MVFKSSKTNLWHVAGVISKYTPEIVPVYETQLQAKNDGSGIDPIGYFRQNPGIINVSNIKHAVDLIVESIKNA